MMSPTPEARIFCTYIHLRPDGSPLYVGKGTRERAKRISNRQNPHYQRAIAKYGAANIQIKIVKRNLTEQEAFFYEREAIACLRAFDYRLANLTDGGEGTSGWNPSPEIRERMRLRQIGRKHSLEARKKISDSHKGKTFSKEHRAKLSVIARNRSDEANRKNSEWHKARRYSDETKEKMRIAHTGKWHTEETKKKMSESAKRWRALKKEQSNG